MPSRLRRNRWPMATPVAMPQDRAQPAADLGPSGDATVGGACCGRVAVDSSHTRTARPPPRGARRHHRRFGLRPPPARRRTVVLKPIEAVPTDQLLDPEDHGLVEWDPTRTIFPGVDWLRFASGPAARLAASHLQGPKSSTVQLDHLLSLGGSSVPHRSRSGPVISPDRPPPGPDRRSAATARSPGRQRRSRATPRPSRSSSTPSKVGPGRPSMARSARRRPAPGDVWIPVPP